MDHTPATEINPHISPTARWIGATPLVVFLAVYLLTSLILRDFYAMPITVAFLIASVYAVGITRGLSTEKRVLRFSRGVADYNLLMMIWIFILAGAFSEAARSIGAIDATVHLILSLLPSSLLLPGLFLASCVISLSIGTSVGTVVALVPIAIGLSEPLGLPVEYIAGIVTGGAFFGDNLSFISDTTIAATRTQGCSMRDKFRVNLRIVLPAAVITFLIYAFRGADLTEVPVHTDPRSPYLALPYLVVLIAAARGVNVAAVLALGIAVCGLVGAVFGTFVFWPWIGALGQGIVGMGELIIVTMLAGGMLELIRFNGGIDFLMKGLTRGIRGKRGAEAAIAALVSVANVCTANNTIAILTTGAMAREITARYGIDPRKAASILDTFSCLVQGMIPYGAQLLLAARFAEVSPMAIIGSLYYPFIMGGCAILSIALRLPRKYS